MAENVEPLEAKSRRAVGRVFATLKTSFPAWYEKHYGDKRAETLARRVWMTGIRDLDDEQVDRGLQRMVLELDFPPSLKVFIRLCQRVDGLPTPEAAWYQAVQGQYGHEVVKAAAKLTGLYELRRATYSEKRLRVEFEHNYAVVIRRLESGEPLDGTVLKAIGHDSQKTAAELAEEHAERQMRERLEHQGLGNATGAQARQQLLASLRIRRPEASA